MNIFKERKAIDAALDNYRSQLNVIPDDLFDVTPPNGGWSYSEVYSHILQATMASSVAAERCTHATNKPVKGGINFFGRVVLLSGRFPPVKIKIPESVAGRITPQKISKEEAKNLIIKCRKRIDDLLPIVNDNISKRLVQHPRLGMLNSTQWFKFMRIHLEHHLKQLKRIDTNFTN